MKKIITVVVIALITTNLYINTNSNLKNKDVSLLSIKTAHADTPGESYWYRFGEWTETTITVRKTNRHGEVYYEEETSWDCDGWTGNC